MEPLLLHSTWLEAITNTLVIAIICPPKFTKQKEELESTQLSAVSEAAMRPAHSSPTRESLCIVLTNRIFWFVASVLVVYHCLEISTSGWVGQSHGPSFTWPQNLDLITNKSGIAPLMLGHTLPVDSGWTYARSYCAWLSICCYTPRETNGLDIHIIARCIQFIFLYVLSVPISGFSTGLIGVFIGLTFPLSRGFSNWSSAGHLHVGVIRFIVTFRIPRRQVGSEIEGSIGAALIQFVGGLVAQPKGQEKLMTLLSALHGTTLVIWAIVPTHSCVD